MRGRDEDGARPRRRAPAGSHDQALRIDGDRPRPRIRQQQLCVSQGVAGILNPHLVAGGEQHADRDVERLLRTGGDHDLLRLATHRARGTQIVADVGAQLDEPGGIGIAEIIRPELANRAMGQASPRLRCARIDQRAAGVERARVGGCGLRAVDRRGVRRKPPRLGHLHLGRCRGPRHAAARGHAGEA